jgi:hypothetical protein
LALGGWGETQLCCGGFGALAKPLHHCGDVFAVSHLSGPFLQNY